MKSGIKWCLLIYYKEKVNQVRSNQGQTENHKAKKINYMFLKRFLGNDTGRRLFFYFFNKML